MNCTEQRPRFARRWPKLSLTALAALLLGTLVVAPSNVAARPFVGADFQRFDGPIFAKHVRLHAKHAKRAKHGKAKKRGYRGGPRHIRHRVVAHTWWLGASSGALLSLHSNWPLPGVSDDLHVWSPSGDTGEQDAVHDFVEGGHDVDAPASVTDESTTDESTDEATAAPGLAPDLIDLTFDIVPGDGTEGDNKMFTEIGEPPPLPSTPGPFSDDLPATARADLFVSRTVPEPNTLMLAALASLAAWRLARRNRRAMGGVRVATPLSRLIPPRPSARAVS